MKTWIPQRASIVLTVLAIASFASTGVEAQVRGRTPGSSIPSLVEPREALDRGDDPRLVWDRWQEELQAWSDVRSRYLLYR